MKSDHRYVIFKAILFFAFILFLSVEPNCKNPNEYKPPEDSLLPPPAPPELLTPPDSFIHMPFVGGNRLLISWEHIEGAETYEINIVGERTKEWTLQLDTNILTQNWADTSLIDKYTWKVRAYGSKWDYYTDWSVPRHFEVVRMRFAPPVLIYPPYDTVLFFDSLPANIDLTWSEVPKAQSYDYQVFLDETPIYENTVYTTHSVITIDSATVYTWGVRANSPLWEFPTNWAGGRFSVQLR
ncbi:MAG: hypothetical protein ACPL28_05525 [bacterium]